MTGAAGGDVEDDVGLLAGGEGLKPVVPDEVLDLRCGDVGLNDLGVFHAGPRVRYAGSQQPLIFPERRQVDRHGPELAPSCASPEPGKDVLELEQLL